MAKKKETTTFFSIAAAELRLHVSGEMQQIAMEGSRAKQPQEIWSSG